MRTRLVFAAAALLLATPAFAQHEPAEPEPKKEPREVYLPVEHHDFENPVVIEGEWVRPIGGLITSKGVKEFPKFIQERAHFKRELAKSAKLPVR